MDHQVQIERWTEAPRPTETRLRARLAAEGLQPYLWSNGAGDVYGAHSHGYHKVLYVVRGAITFGLPDQGEQVTLQAGDRLDLPAHVRHEAVVGPQGVACLEAQRK